MEPDVVVGGHRVWEVGGSSKTMISNYPNMKISSKFEDDEKVLTKIVRWGSFDHAKDTLEHSRLNSITMLGS